MCFTSLQRGHSEFRWQPMLARRRRALPKPVSSVQENLRSRLVIYTFLAVFRSSCAGQVVNVVEHADGIDPLNIHSNLTRFGLGQGEPVRRLTTGLASVTNLAQSTDIHTSYLRVAGLVTWDLPTDMTGINSFMVRFSWDIDGTSLKKTLYDWDALAGCSCVSSSTAQWNLGDSTWGTTRQDDSGTDLTTYPAADYPHSWIFVHSSRGTFGNSQIADADIQTVAEAAKLLAVDVQTDRVPNSIQLETLTLEDQTSSANFGTHVAGILRWTTTGPDYPQVGEDWAIVSSFEVFLAEAGNLGATLTRSLGTVALGTTTGQTDWSLTFAETELLGTNALVVKAVNSVGQAALSAGQSEVYELPTTTSTSVTSTSTVLHNMVGSTVTFSDTDSTGGSIAGTITWEQPLSLTDLTYAIYMAYDNSGSYGKKLADGIAGSSTSYTISPAITRETSDGSYPANWIIIYPELQGTIQGISVAASQELYDDSGAIPPAPAFNSVDFSDQDSRGGYISGTIRWDFSGNADLAYTTHYVVTIAENQAGDNEVAFGSAVPVGTNEVTESTGVYIDARYHAIVKARNSYGDQTGYIQTPSQTSQPIIDVGSSTSTSSTSSVTSSLTATTTSSTSSTTSISTTSNTMTSVTTTSYTVTTSTETTFTSNTGTTITISSSSTSSTTTSLTITSTSVTQTTLTSTSKTSSSTTMTSTSFTSSSTSETSSTTMTSSRSTTSTTSETSTSSSSTRTTKTTSTSATTTMSKTGTTSTQTTLTTTSSSATATSTSFTHSSTSSSTLTSTTSTSSTSRTMTSTSSSSTTRTGGPEEMCFAGASGAGEHAQRSSADAGDTGVVQAQKAGQAAAASAAACGLSPEHQARAAAAAAQVAAQEAGLGSTQQISAAADAASSAATGAGLDETATAEAVAAAVAAAAAAIAASAGQDLAAQVAAAAQAALDHAIQLELPVTQQVLEAGAAAAAAVFADQVLKYDTPASCPDGSECWGSQCCSASTCPTARPTFAECGDSHASVLAQPQIDAAAQWAMTFAGQLGMLPDQQGELSALAAGAAAGEAARERGENCTAQFTAAGLAAAQAAANASLPSSKQAELAAAAAAAAAAASAARNGNLAESSDCSSKQGQVDAAAQLAELIAIQAGMSEEEIFLVVTLAVREAEFQATDPSNRTTTVTSTSSSSTSTSATTTSITSTTTLPVLMCMDDEPDCNTYMEHTQRCQANCSGLLYGYRTCIVTSTSHTYVGESFCVADDSGAVLPVQRDLVLGSVNVVVNSSTPLTVEKAREALATVMGVLPSQIEELNTTLVQTDSGAVTYSVDYVIKVWTLEEVQEVDATLTEAQGTSSILGFSHALRAEGSQTQAQLQSLLETQEVQVISLGTSPVVPTIITVTTIAEADPSGDPSGNVLSGSSLGVAVAVLALLCCAGMFVLLVVCCSKMQQMRLVQAKAEKQVKEEAARAQEMQDNFDMVRSKISVMLPKLEPGHGPVVGRIQHVMEENDFEPADDMLPDEREVVQSTRHASLRDFTQEDAFAVDIGEEVLSLEERNAVAQITGRRRSQVERNLRRLGLDEGQHVEPTGTMNSARVPDDVGSQELPTIKPSSVVTSYANSIKSPQHEASGFGRRI